MKGPEPKNIQAVLFDLDGTLIDTERYYRQIWPQAVAHFGYEMTDAQYLMLRSLGRPFAREKFAAWYGPAFDYDEVRAYRMTLFQALREREGIRLKPGAREILEYLRGRGILVATATATDEDRTRNYLTEVGLLPLFDRICCATQVSHGKPAPNLYLYACETLGLSPQECLAVEDAPNGIRSAIAAGVPVVFIPDQTQEEPEVEPLVYRKLSSLTELKSLFEP